MKASELKQLIREEVRRVINEAYQVTIAGDTIKGTGDKYPDVIVNIGVEFITISQKINGRTSKVLLSKKQFAQLVKEA